MAEAIERMLLLKYIDDTGSELLPNNLQSDPTNIKIILKDQLEGVGRSASKEKVPNVLKWT